MAPGSRTPWPRSGPGRPRSSLPVRAGLAAEGPPVTEPSSASRPRPSNPPKNRPTSPPASPTAAVPPFPREPLPEIDTSVAHAARVYDYLLGGTNNFAADRTAAHAQLDAMGNTLEQTRSDLRVNRDFLGRAV